MTTTDSHTDPPTTPRPAPLARISYGEVVREIEASAARACADAMEATIRTLDRYEAEGVPKDEQDIDYAGISRRAVAVNLNAAALTELAALIEASEQLLGRTPRLAEDWSTSTIDAAADLLHSIAAGFAPNPWCAGARGG
jgi:hypothetical protein